MVVSTAVIVAATVMSLLTQAISMASGIARDVIRSKYGKELNSYSKKITPLLNQNESLRNQISNALQNQNSKLASDLLMASPLSSIVSKLAKNIETNEKGLKETDEHFNEQREIAESAERDAQKISNALDGDIASATEGKHAWKGQAGDSIRNKVTKLEQTNKDVMKQLQEAKKKTAHIPQAGPSVPNSNMNIGVMDRSGTSPVPVTIMKGNN